MRVVTVKEMRQLEAAADAAGHSYAQMMEIAGQRVAEAIQARCTVKGAKVLVLVGPGNNGGDGLVAARYLAKAGAEVHGYLLKPRDPAQDENFRLAIECEVETTFASNDHEWERLRRLTSEAHVLVDALFGTGTQPPLRGAVAELLRSVKEVLAERARPTLPSLVRLGGLPAPPQVDRPLIVAVDGPSGMDFDNGELDDSALCADLTVTFAYPKRGHFLFPAAAALGELVVADIGITSLSTSESDLEVATPEMVRELLPARPPMAHKGTFGRALIIAGSVNYTGAACLAGAAAARAGAGLVTVALPSEIHSAVAARLTEATYILLPHELGVIAPSAVEVLSEYLEAYDALLIGPGLGRERPTKEFLQELLGAAEHRPIGFVPTSEVTERESSLPPLVLDADALNILAELPDWPKRLPTQSVLTPHPGEMARLMHCTVAEVQADRVGAAQKQAALWQHVVVLKGAYTVIAAPDGRTVIQPFANAGLASGGTGDVLAGTIVALRAQGLGAFEAAVAGAYLHAAAGEYVRAEKGVAGTVASDLLTHLPCVWRTLTAQQPLHHWTSITPQINTGTNEQSPG